MRPALDQLFLLGLFSAAIHWLVARSEIARPLWSRTTGTVAKLLACPACSGWWLGGLLSLTHAVRPLDGAPLWWSTIAGALAGVVLTPVFEAVLLWALAVTAMSEEPPA